MNFPASFAGTRALAGRRALAWALCSSATFGCAEASPGSPSASATVEPTTPPPPPALGGGCQATDQTFARRAILALLGRHPSGQGEVEAIEQAIQEIRRVDDTQSDPLSARRTVARALMQDEGYFERWSDFFMDALKVARTGTKSLETCYGSPRAEAYDAGALARYVRDHDASANEPPGGEFTMNELLRSALALDDLSVLYRSHLFAMMSRHINGNASPDELELARRNDYGAGFEAAYTSRNLTCLGCHNSQFSVTQSSDPELNRFWPVPGLFEQSLFGSSTGVLPQAEGDPPGSDLLRTRSMFRVNGVVDEAGTAPYGWDGARCGRFRIPESDDPLVVDTYFGSVRGLRASVWDLERSLHRGVDALAAHGLQPASDTSISDPDTAFAYLVALTIVEEVWVETVGSGLTIAHHFPRTQDQRDLLARLTNRFVASHFSLKTLLSDIVSEPAFNLPPPSTDCLATPYSLPRLFNPWSDAEQDASRRGNSSADTIFPISPRPLRKSLHRALGWPAYPEYPAQGSNEEALQLALGFALRDAEPGQRGLDFQGRLAWEAAYGACAPQAADDFIAQLAERALTPPRRTVLAALAALKDRLVGMPTVFASERPKLEALLGTSLDSPAPDDVEAKLRSVCGVLIASPQFQLGGLEAPDARGVPTLAPAAASVPASCRRLEGLLVEVGASHELSCSGE